MKVYDVYIQIWWGWYVFIEQLMFASGLFYIIYSIGMKRSASSSKQNLIRSYFSKHPSRQKLPYQPDIKLLSQTITPNKQIHPCKTPLPDFYQTFNHNHFTEFSRPQSKQAFRKCIGRPQTSKGVRPLQRTANAWQGEHKIGCYSQYVMERKDFDESVETEPSIGSNIEIIVTKSSKRKGDKKIRGRFQTDLDDQFLQLFAN